MMGVLRVEAAQLGGVDVDALGVVEDEEDLLEGAGGGGVEVVADGLQDDLGRSLLRESRAGTNKRVVSIGYNTKLNILLKS